MMEFEERHASGAGRTSRRSMLGGAVSLAGLAIGSGSLMDTAAAGSSPSPVSGAALRTPDRQFRGLPGYRFDPRYELVSGVAGSGPPLRLHYLDERPVDPARASGDVVLLLHGNPAWSYQYRHVIPDLVAAGHRCIAPDLIGFGRSDKPSNRFAHTYARQVEWLREFVVDRLDLNEVTLVVHDWGGLLGLRLWAENAGRVKRVVVSDTRFHTGDKDLGEGWPFLAQWMQFSQRMNPFSAATVVEQGTVADLDQAVLTAYEAPFPTDDYAVAARQFALLLPITPWDEASAANRDVWRVLETLDTPVHCAFSDRDPTTAGADQEIRTRIPGARHDRHVTITNAGHFVTEEKPKEFAAAVNAFIADR